MPGRLAAVGLALQDTAAAGVRCCASCCMQSWGTTPGSFSDRRNRSRQEGRRWKESPKLSLWSVSCPAGSYMGHSRRSHGLGVLPLGTVGMIVQFYRFCCLASRLAFCVIIHNSSETVAHQEETRQGRGTSRHCIF